ncbi:(2Fe-2S) ferredoxin domain-containing protein [Algoriphagus namhaensis]
MKHPRKLIFICCGSDCKKAGCKKLSKDLAENLNQAPYKGKFKFIKTKCLDMCKSAPVTIIQDHFFKKASPERMLKFIDED